MKTLRIVLALSLACAASADTTKNDDSCDISVMPAATLLLPYFEVDLDDQSETTNFTITNVTNLEQIARVTLWTDRAYPVLTFNVYLTGYDVQALSLYDVLARGIIAPDGGMGTALARRGKFSDRNAGLELAKCAALPGALDAAAVTRLQSAFLDGTTVECEDAGNAHDNAIGYATVDVVGNCSSNAPDDSAYWSTDLRYDNVLIGDYQQISGNIARGGPLVHIRAIPEGRKPAVERFPRTFYARYTKLDGRQPLPARFATRWTEGTSLKIWREARTGLRDTCDDYAADAHLAVADVVVFDDAENAAGLDGARLTMPATSRHDVDDESFPQIGRNGWMYLNLDRSRRDGIASQAWVIASHSAGTDVEAIPLDNGCDVSPRRSIAPGKGDDSCDIALLPAATLLLPWFEIDPDDRNGESTTFTITNVSPQERIARVTLWTDWAFPVITFNVALTGYDTQTVNLYDVIAGGVVSACGGVTELSQPFIARMQSAFIEGSVSDLGDLASCMAVGGEHENAAGYATIDVVRNCSTRSPVSAEYFTDDIAFDNVLIGDWQHTGSRDGGSPLVHIRAMPGVAVPATFYAGFQSEGTPTLDARQPLPVVFAARWLQGGPAGFQTSMKIWRAAPISRPECGLYDDNIAWYHEIVTFDEAENAAGNFPRHNQPIGPQQSLPAASFLPVTEHEIFPRMTNGATSGWMYFNFADAMRGRDSDRSNWVVSSMRAAGGYSVEIDAAAMGNGCSPRAGYSEVVFGTEIIGPRP